MLAIAPLWLTMDSSNVNRAPRVGHKKSRKGCAQCKRRHVKVCHISMVTRPNFMLEGAGRADSHSLSQCNEESPCANCVRHSVPCSLAGGPNVQRDDAKAKPRSPATSISSHSTRTSSHDATAAYTSATARASSISSTRSPPDSNEYSPIHVLTGSIDRNVALTNQA